MTRYVSDTMVRIMVLCWASSLVLAGVAAIMAILLIDYSWVEGLVLAHSYSGDPAFLSPEYFGRVVFRARIFGAGLIMAGFALWWSRQYIIDTFSRWHWGSLNTGIFRDPAWYAIAILYLGLAGYFLNQPMHPDEARTVNAYALRPAIVAWADTTAPNNHVLHTLAVKASIALFGVHEASVRLPSYLAGLGILLGGYLLALQLFGHRHYARAYAALLATAGPVLFFTCMGRGYSIMLACMLFLFWAVGGLSRDACNARYGLTYAAAMIVGMLTLKLTIMPLLAAFTFVCVSAMWKSDRHALDSFRGFVLINILAGLAVVAFYAPSLVMVEQGMLTDQPAVVPLVDWPKAFARSMMPSWTFYVYGSYAPVWMTLSAAFLYFGLTHYRRPAFMLVVLAVIWTVLPLAAFRYLPYIRIMIHLYVLWLLGAVGGMHGVLSRAGRYPLIKSGAMALMGVAVMANGFGVVADSEDGILMPGYHLSDAPDIVKTIKDDLRKDDLIVCRSPSASSLIFYFNRHGLDHRIYDVMEYRPEVGREDIGRRLVLIRRDRQSLTAESTTIAELDDIAFQLEETIRFPRSTVEMYRMVMP